MTGDGDRRRYRFFNTYEPVVPVYRDVPPALVAGGARVELVVGKGEYRRGRGLDEFVAEQPGVSLKKVSSLGVASAVGLRSKALVNLAYLAHAGLYALLGPRASCNVFLTQPPFFNVVGRMFSRWRRQACVCVCMDIQPDLLVAYGLMEPDGRTTRLLAWATRKALRGADAVVVIGRCMRDHVEALGVPPDRIHLIRNWADERRIVPLDHADNSFRQAQDWGDEFVVMYAGNLGLAQSFDALLGAAELLQEDSRIRFVFIGEGVREGRLRDRAALLENVVFHPFLHTRHTLSEIYGAGDLQVVSLADPCTGMAVPSKAYSVMAAGRPVLFRGSERCEIARIVREEGVGSVVDDDAGRVAETIVAYAEDPERGREEGRRARALSEGRYSRRNAVRRYLELLERA